MYVLFAQWTECKVYSSYAEQYIIPNERTTELKVW